MNEDLEKLFDGVQFRGIREVAAFLGFSSSGLRTLAFKGMIRSCKMRHKVMFHKTHVAEYLAKQIG